MLCHLLHLVGLVPQMLTSLWLVLDQEMDLVATKNRIVRLVGLFSDSFLLI